MREPAPRNLIRLVGILFLSYLCIAMSLPVVPVFVTDRLGLGNVAAGLGVGMVFLATIASRARAGGISDRRGPKTALGQGLLLYIAGALVSALSGAMPDMPAAAYAVLLAGRVVLGIGESLVTVGVVAWAIGIGGPARSGGVLALIGAAMYGAFAVGGPVGLALLGSVGFAGTMLVGAILPCLGLLAIRGIPGIEAHPAGPRTALRQVLGAIWPHGSIVCLQGIGFAAIGAFFALLFLDRGWAHAGLGLTAFGGGFVVVRLLLGHLPDRLGGLRVAMISLGVEAVGQALIWSAGHALPAMVGAFMTGLGCSLVFPSMGREVVRLVDPRLRGTAMGSFAAFQDLAYGLTGPLAGFLADRAGYGSVFLIGAVAAGTGLVVAALLRARESRRVEEPL
ncbi:arabinose transporter [Roseomonas sp. HJA6]|uniref:Uncharacterized MFS-type transporter KPL78_17140 n=2 Tax=Roseomonas alba TaxID=2846776 RepID=A0ABS7ACW2_9PROT|nr:arabinose transporter [Neoroseomonas alba]